MKSIILSLFSLLVLLAFRTSASPLYCDKGLYYTGGWCKNTEQAKSPQIDNPYGPLGVVPANHPSRRDDSVTAKRGNPVPPYPFMLAAYRLWTDFRYRFTGSVPPLDRERPVMNINGCQFRPSPDGLAKDEIICPPDERDGEQKLRRRSVADEVSVIVPRDDNTQEIVEHVGDSVVAAVEASLEIIGGAIVGIRSDTNANRTSSDVEHELPKRAVADGVSAVLPREEMEIGDKAASIANGVAGAFSIALHILGSALTIGKRSERNALSGVFFHQPTTIAVEGPQTQAIEKRHLGTGGQPTIGFVDYVLSLCSFCPTPHDNEKRSLSKRSMEKRGDYSDFMVWISERLSWRPKDVILVVDPGANLEEEEIQDLPASYPWISPVP